MSEARQVMHGRRVYVLCGEITGTFGYLYRKLSPSATTPFCGNHIYANFVFENQKLRQQTEDNRYIYYSHQTIFTE